MHGIRTQYDAGENVDITVHDPHAVAGLVKLFLREMTDPLLTFQLYSEWLEFESTSMIQIGP